MAHVLALLIAGEGLWAMFTNPVKYPFKARLIDLRYPNVDYIIKIKDQQDWIKIKSLEESANFRVEIKSKSLEQTNSSI